MRRNLTPEQRRLVEAFASLTAVAIERVHLAEAAGQVQLLEAADKLQSALLNSVSHDLRTPLASITGALSSLLDDGAPMDEPSRRIMLETAAEEAGRLNRLVGNLLDMTRLEAGAVTVRRELRDVQDVIGAALHQVNERLADRPVETDIPADLPAGSAGLCAGGSRSGEPARQCAQVLAGGLPDPHRRPGFGADGQHSDRRQGRRDSRGRPGPHL